MRLLFVAPYAPFAVHSGHSVILRNYLAHLGPRHSIDLACVGTAEDAAHPDLQRWCRQVVASPRPQRSAVRAAQLFGLLSGRPLRISAHTNERMRAAVAQLLNSNAYDAVVVHLCEAVQFLPPSIDVPGIFDIEDPPSEGTSRTVAALSRGARLATWCDVPLLRRYERKCAARFDRLVFVNAHDAATFARRYGCADRVVTIAHAVDASEPPPGYRERVPGRLIATGNMAHPPNIAALDYLCGEVFPRIRAAAPTATLRIVGAHATERVRLWGAQPGITVVGEVEDIRKELKEACVALCGVAPLVGIQTKVLEAMACGTPVVTTPGGNGGIDAVDGRELHVAANADLFAAKTIALLRGDGWEQVSSAGRDLVLNRFAPARASAELERLIEDAIRAAASRRR